MIRIVIGVLALAACGDQLKVFDGAACETDEQCVLGEVSGSCQSNGFCAYPDPACSDGLRYSPGATGVEGICVGGCEATGTCTCGANDQPCCDGSTCDDGLTCAEGTCAAGVEQIALGHHAGCMLRTDGVVTCWGADKYRFGSGRPGGAANVVAPGMVAITDVVELDRGVGHTCARKMDGTVWCWGHNEIGQLGDGTTVSSPVPVQATGLVATQLSVGFKHTCAVGTVGAVTGVFCWGRNDTGNDATVGRLGTGDDQDKHVPTAVDMTQMAPAGQTVRDVAAGDYYTCAIMSDDRAWCWGRNNNNELGTNDTGVSTAVPTLVDLSQITIPTGVTLAELAADKQRGGGTHTALRLSNGTVYVWGNGDTGALGDGPPSGSRSRPTTAVDMTALGTATFTSIASASSGFCGVTTAGSVFCWGDRKQGAVGNDDAAPTGPQEVPIQVEGLPATVTSLSGGHRAMCAIDSAKHVWCWGNNRRGVLSRTTPTTDEQSRFLIATDVTP